MSNTMSRWGEHDTLRLIELYKKHTFLWNYESDLYKNPCARKKAFESILLQLNIPGLTVNDVRSKIKNLRTSYYQEKRKILVAKANNKEVKPLKWYNAFKGVMRSILNRKANDIATDESDSEDERETEAPSETNINSEILLEEVPSNDTDTYVVSIKQEFLDEMENLGDKSFTPTICDYLEPVPSKRAKIHEPPKNIEPRATEAPKNVESQRSYESKSNKKVDEFQMFANNIAHQLRKLPLSRALNLQIEVQTLIAKERIEVLKKQGELADESS